MKTLVVAAALLSPTFPGQDLKTQEQLCAEGGGCVTFTMHAIERLLEHNAHDAYMSGLQAAKCRPPT